MLLLLLHTFIFVALTTAQKTSNDPEVELKQPQENKPTALLATPLNLSQNRQKNALLKQINQFYAKQQLIPEVYGLTYLQPQHQNGEPLARLQPQLVLYGPGGQGQPILINPGNPPGNFLIPQGPGPNVIVRNNPQAPQSPIFPGPIAGYPRPAHIPPIEKDAEEIPTNPAKIPPLGSDSNKPTGNRRGKPEKIETFTESSPVDQNKRNNEEPQPQFNTESGSLRPGQRFFILNGNNIYNYPFEEHSNIGQLHELKYTNVLPFPQEPSKFLLPFSQEPPPKFLEGGETQPVVSLPNLLLRNSFISSQPQQDQKQIYLPSNLGRSENIDGALKSAEQYFRTAELPQNKPTVIENPQKYQQEYISEQEGTLIGQSEPQSEGYQSSIKDAVQPQLVGQFRFTPNSYPGSYQFTDDLENDAIVVDASFDAPTNFDGRGGNPRDEENTTGSTQTTESEPSMAQAGPQATAIAGVGGVAGSAPKGTAIVGKGGFAVSSPQATAVAGTKEEEKKKKPVKKN